MILDDIAEYLEDEGVGTVGTNIFKSYLPDSVDTGFAILDTGGLMPDPDVPTKEPTFQIFLRAADYATGRAKLDAIRTALHRIANQTLITGGTYFYFILAQSEGGHIGRNDRGLDEFSMNFHCRTQ